MVITAIDETNLEFFETLIPPELVHSVQPLFGAIADDETACGVLAAECDDTFLRISWLYVAEEYRRQQAATMLLDAALEVAVMSGQDAMYVQYVNDESHADFDSLLEHYGFEDYVDEPDDDEEESELSEKKDGGAEYGDGKLFVTAVRDITPTVLQAKDRLHGKYTALKDLPGYKWKEYTNTFDESENEVDFIFRPVEEYDGECSFVWMKDGNVCGCLLVSRDEESYSLEYLSVQSGESPVHAVELLSEGIQVIQERGDADASIYITAMTAASEKLVQGVTDGKARLLGDVKTRFYYF